MKVLWFLYTDEAVNYSPDAHSMFVFKFLYWNGSDSESVLIAGSENISRHKMLAETALEIGLCPERKPDGAGTCFPGSREVQHWFSIDFEVHTPDELKPLILQALFG